MSELIEKLRKEFHDEETRHIYAEDFLNAYIATQIKVLREKAGWTQAELAQRAGMKQERISVLEDVNYSSWTANVLKRIAQAFDMRLSIKIESFGSYLDEFDSFGKESLLRPSFKDDPAFQEKPKAKEAMSALEPIKDTANFGSRRRVRAHSNTTTAIQLSLWPTSISDLKVRPELLQEHSIALETETTNAATVKLSNDA